MATITVTTIITTTDGVEYKLFLNEAKKWTIRVFDIDTQEVVTIVSYPDKPAAQNAFAIIREKENLN